MRTVFVLSLVVVTSPLLAQSPPAATVREELLVTATLEPQPEERVPGTVDLLSVDEIERRSTGDALDLLRTVPGLAVVQAGSPGKQASVFTRGAASAATLVLWNGVELNDPAFAGFDWSLLSTDGLARIEVVRGPYSALWGSAAMGGVVQLVTRRGGERGGALRLEAGSHDFARASGDGAARFGGLALDLAGHLRTGEGELPNDGYDGGEIVLRAELEPSAASRVGLLVRRNEAEIGLPFDFFGSPSPAREQRFDSTALGLPASFTGERWSVEGALARVESTLALADPDDPFAAAATDARRDSARAVVRRTVERFGWIAAGGEAERETASTSSAFGPGLDGERAGARALFAQVGASRGRWSAEVGLRRDRHDVFGGATSARGGAAFRVHDRLLVRASLGESFRAPSLGDLYFPGFANPDLEPERGRSLELGAEATFGSVRVGATGFENDFRDLIQFDFATFRPENVGRARARGVEAWIAFRRGGLDLRAGATRLDAEDRATGEPLPRRPEWSGQLVASFARARFAAHAALVGVGERIDVGGVALGGYATVDAGASFAWTPRLEPYLRIENLLDRAYEEATGFPAPGRTFALGLALRARE
jgi:vitamin B12 transporter